MLGEGIRRSTPPPPLAEPQGRKSGCPTGRLVLGGNSPHQERGIITGTHEKRQGGRPCHPTNLSLYIRKGEADNTLFKDVESESNFFTYNQTCWLGLPAFVKKKKKKIAGLEREGPSFVFPSFVVT